VSVFGAQYSGVYDALYRDKNYRDEAALVKDAFGRYGSQPITRVLDLGCGTGNHALPLARLGYHVVGVDRSAGMLARAKQKAGASNRRIQFRKGDVRTARLNEHFDAALLMFAVLGYQLSDGDVRAALTTARAHLSPGGLLVFDVWYGPAVLAQRPSERAKVMRRGSERVIRITSGTLENGRPVCAVRYRLWQLKGRRVEAELSETHRMRYFFSHELDTFLAGSGFRLLRLGAFPNFDEDPSESTWNVLGVARAT